jgi:haloalkane dehalogenase
VEAVTNPTTGSRPSWVDDELFPYASNFVEVLGNIVHYVDEGDGPVLLMLHGNPTWSFLYRDMIAMLRTQFRCVALDYPGFGLSRATPGYGFTAAEHADVVEAFVEQLDLTGVTPVVQDWGGPIGMTAAARRADRYRAFVIGNTWAWPRDDRAITSFSAVMGGPVGRGLIERFNLFATRIIPSAHRRRRLSERELRHYTAPFPDARSRVPTHVFPAELTAATVLLEEASRGLEGFQDRPALVLWATKDPMFREQERRRWEQTFDRHETHLLHGAGHYFQDDAGYEAAHAVMDWWHRAIASQT